MTRAVDSSAVLRPDGSVLSCGARCIDFGLLRERRIFKYGVPCVKVGSEELFECSKSERGECV